MGGGRARCARHGRCDLILSRPLNTRLAKLLAVPWHSLSGPIGGPKYLAFHEPEIVEVLRTSAFTDRPRTPWGQRVSASVIGSSGSSESRLPDALEVPERGTAPVLQIGRMSVAAEVEAECNGYVPGVIYARRDRVHERMSRYTTVCEFTGTAVPERAEWKEQTLHSSPRSPRMRQAMTHAPGLRGVDTRIDL
jgi:hypothetical protein